MHGVPARDFPPGKMAESFRLPRQFGRRHRGSDEPEARKLELEQRRRPGRAPRKTSRFTTLCLALVRPLGAETGMMAIRRIH